MLIHRVWDWQTKRGGRSPRVCFRGPDIARGRQVGRKEEKAGKEGRIGEKIIRTECSFVLCAAQGPYTYISLLSSVF